MIILTSAPFGVLSRSMPARKKTTKTTSRAKTKEEPVKAERVTTQTATVDEISYETKLTIVILLLLFVYPLGLVFMWFWMRNWPLWLKILISLPIIIGILGILFGIFALAMILRHVATDKNFQYQMRQYQYQQEQQLTPSPSEAISPTDTVTPTTTDNSNSTGTY